MMLLRLLLAIVYGLGIVILIACAAPFVLIGFCVGFIRWCGGVGSHLADQLFTHFR